MLTRTNMYTWPCYKLTVAGIIGGERQRFDLLWTIPYLQAKEILSLINIVAYRDVRIVLEVVTLWTNNCQNFFYLDALELRQVKTFIVKWLKFHCQKTKHSLPSDLAFISRWYENIHYQDDELPLLGCWTFTSRTLHKDS